MRFGTSYGTFQDIEPGELVACIQVGHTYEHHTVTEYCLFPHPVNRRCDEHRCTCQKRKV